MTNGHIGTQYDRLDPEHCTRDGERPSRNDIITFFDTRYGIDPATFAPYSFWERGKGKIWAFRGEQQTPARVEAMGIHLLRTDSQFWKPTTDAMQLFGRYATENIIELEEEEANAFWRGVEVEIVWTGDPRYVIVARDYGDTTTPIGVGLARESRLESLVPKGRQRDHDRSN